MDIYDTCCGSLSQEYAQEPKLKELVTKFSEFTNFPIYLLTEKEVDVPIEDVETKEGESLGGGDSLMSKFELFKFGLFKFVKALLQDTCNHNSYLSGNQKGEQREQS